MQDKQAKIEYFAGLDWGPPQDFTALAVVECRKTVVADDLPLKHYAVRHLERFPPELSCGEITSRVTALLTTEPLAACTLAVDRTAVGKAVVGQFRRAGIWPRLREVVLTAGHRTTVEADGTLLVPRQELAGTVQVLLQSRRLMVAQELPHAPLLVQELLHFRPKAAPVTDVETTAWRERINEDLVLAVALAAWLAENTPEPYTGPLVYWPPVDLTIETSRDRPPLQEIVEAMEWEEDEERPWWR